DRGDAPDEPRDRTDTEVAPPGAGEAEVAQRPGSVAADGGDARAEEPGPEAQLADEQEARRVPAETEADGGEAEHLREDDRGDDAEDGDPPAPHPLAAEPRAV